VTSRHAIKAVLHNLLGTFTSRNSDYKGYWMLGFLVADVDRRSIDLLVADPPDGSRTTWDAATQLAVARFREQALKLGVPMEAVRDAELQVERLPGAAKAVINSKNWQGFKVRLVARATMDSGRSYERDLRVFVAPHSRRELRRTKPARWRPD
jgi:hypothetical protein